MKRVAIAALFRYYEKVKVLLPRHVRLSTFHTPTVRLDSTFPLRTIRTTFRFWPLHATRQDNDY